jgi:hypothetical protein
VVLSGKHGFLFPDDMVDGPYDVTFGQKNVEVISIETLRQQVKDKQLEQYDALVILTGKKYKPYINGAFSETMEKSFPLAGFTGIGHMQKALKQAINAGQPLG